MDIETEKVKKTLKEIFEKASQNASNEDVINTLLTKLDKLGKIDGLYQERLTELVEEQRFNKKLEEDIKLVELTLKLKQG